MEYFCNLFNSCKGANMINKIVSWYRNLKGQFVPVYQEVDEEDIDILEEDD